MSSQNWLQSTHKFHRFEIIFGTGDDDRSKLGTTGRIYSIGTAFGFFEQTTIRAIVGSTDRPTHQPTNQRLHQRSHRRSHRRIHGHDEYTDSDRSKQKVTMINARMWSDRSDTLQHSNKQGIVRCTTYSKGDKTTMGIDSFTSNNLYYKLYHWIAIYTIPFIQRAPCRLTIHTAVTVPV